MKLIFKIQFKNTILLIIFITSIDLLYRFYEIWYLERILNNINVYPIEDKIYIIKIHNFQWIQISSNLIFTLILITWLYVSYKKLYQLHSDKLQYSPSWVIWGSLIPIVNFYILYKIILDLWEHTVNRFHNNSLKNNFIQYWWILFVIVIIYSRIVSNGLASNHADDLLIYNYKFIFINIGFLIYLFVLIKISNDIYKIQNHSEKLRI